MRFGAHREFPDAIRHHAMTRRQRGPARISIGGEGKSEFQGRGWKVGVRCSKNLTHPRLGEDNPHRCSHADFTRQLEFAAV